MNQNVAIRIFHRERFFRVSLPMIWSYVHTLINPCLLLYLHQQECSLSEIFPNKVHGQANLSVACLEHDGVIFILTI